MTTTTEKKRGRGRPVGTTKKKVKQNTTMKFRPAVRKWLQSKYKAGALVEQLILNAMEAEGDGCLMLVKVSKKTAEKLAQCDKPELLVAEVADAVTDWENPFKEREVLGKVDAVMSRNLTPAHKLAAIEKLRITDF